MLADAPSKVHQLLLDLLQLIQTSWHKFVDFIAPKWNAAASHADLPASLRHFFEQAQFNTTFWSDVMLSHFDSNGDGHISSNEMLNMSEILSKLRPPNPETFWSWFSREWPLMDWKIGLFVWRTFGGILLVLALLTIIPGRLHAYSAKLLRWPVLGLTYFLIGVELIVYVIIRVGIRVAEALVARPKHQRLRRQMAQAKSYDEWHGHASALDKSQYRDRWLRRVNDYTGYRYNWAFIRELIKDMRIARTKGDSLLALAVVQQCTRQNVGGIMSADLFSYSNLGEPKYIVREFIDEVVTTLNWLTDEALKVPDDPNAEASEKNLYEEKMLDQVRGEKDKLWKALFRVLDQSSEHGSPKNEESNGKEKVGAIHRDAEDDLISTTSDNGYYDEKSDSKIPVTASLPTFHREEVLTFLRRARHAYGRTALCLSGGAMMGMYHFGHIRGLLETGNLPRIVCGTSAGAVIGSIVGTRTDEELDRDLQPDILFLHMKCFDRPWGERIRSLFSNGNFFDFDTWMNMIKWFTCGDLTFQEAYKKTGRVFCITLSSTTKKAPPVLLNHLSAPNVTIASAVIASAAVPGFIPPVRLQYKDSQGNVRVQGGSRDQTYFDGSIRHDIPVAGLAEMLNCQFFVACQCNPHVVPFFFNTRGSVGRPSRWSSGSQEESWRGGFLLAALEMYLKNDMKAKFVFLNDMEAAVGFTSTLMTQEFVGTITIVPQVSIWDYTRLFRDPYREELPHYFFTGAIAAYEHTAMIKMHYRISDALDDCVARLETATRGRTNVKHRSILKAAEGMMNRAQFEVLATGGGGPGPMGELVESAKAKKTADQGLFSAGTMTSDSTDEEDEYSSNWIDLQ